MMTLPPEAMENVFRAVGATRSITEVEQCCGWPASYATTQSFQMAGMHIQDAITSGADCMVTPCPLCHLNLDSRQPEVERSSVAGSTSAAFTAVDCSGTGH